MSSWSCYTLSPCISSLAHIGLVLKTRAEFLLYLRIHIMAEQEEEDSKVNSPPPPPPFLEVTCKSLGKTSRFAAGTKAGFAVSLINRKLDVGAPFVLHIEAVKDGEEPISFGPDAVLVDYGNGWKLQTFTVLDYVGVRQAEHFQQIPKQSSDGSRPAKTATNPGISFLYMAKILVAFVLLFVLGASLTLALENLPRLILFINSFMPRFVLSLVEPSICCLIRYLVKILNFLEVMCKSLGKTSRFAAGTKAGFAVSLINRKLDVGAPFVLHIEAVKDGEEPISFGPDAVLVDYGNGWKLQTFTVLDYVGVRQAEHFQQIPKQSSDGSRPAKTATNTGISFLYMAKILVAFVLLFVLGASFTLALENLPRLILFINSFIPRFALFSVEPLICCLIRYLVKILNMEGKSH
ncbi:hypothetical protein NC651_030201 [Populus alba x Populus x berolinensis]|nr:hypothetical protein NC651_030201 [Populus alba x Populus x berolinensis]